MHIQEYRSDWLDGQTCLWPAIESRVLVFTVLPSASIQPRLIPSRAFRSNPAAPNATCKRRLHCVTPMTDEDICKDGILSSLMAGPSLYDRQCCVQMPSPAGM